MMSHFTGQAAINNRQTTSIDEILKTMYLQLAAHPWLNDECKVLDENNRPIRITKFRNYDGYELKHIGAANQKGLSLSIFPHNFSDNLTTRSGNASVVYKPYTLNGTGDTPSGPLDEATAHIHLKLHCFGYDIKEYTDPFITKGQQTVFEFNQNETILHRWAETLKLILTGDRMRKLPSVAGPARLLLSSSHVEWLNFPTSNWTKDGNIVFHTASLLWSVVYYQERTQMTNELVWAVPTDTNIGTIPGDIIVKYNFDTNTYYNADTLETLTITQLTDPDTGTFYSTLATSIIHIIDLANSSRNDFISIYQV